ncbi:MAG: hypothetical protein JW759_05645 [Candidatus Coatesbacteria bacterium]|nr:hypothetical protein [Candidatus Coatesbacteria bacterium]
MLVILIAWMVGVPPVCSYGQTERFKESIRRQESRAPATDETKTKWATGDSKAHRRARQMLEKVRGTGHGGEDYQPMSPDEVEERMKETEERSKYFLWTAVGIPAVLLALFGLKFFFNVFVKPVVTPARRSYGTRRAAQPSPSQARKLVSMAKRYERKGAILDAAQLFEAADEVQSMSAQARKGVPQAPAKRDNLQKAADLYEKAGDYRKASELVGKLRLPGKMKELFLLQGKEYESQRKYLLAAEMYAKAEDFVGAATMNEAAGHLHGAAAYYEKVGEKLKAAELFERFYEQEKIDHFASMNDQSTYSYVRKYALKSAKLYATCGKLRKSARIFAEFSEHIAAGKMLLEGQQYVEAVSVLVKSDDVALLREALSKADMEKIDPELLAAAMEKVGDPEAAAAALLKAGRLIEAAAIYERRGQLNEAAEIYERQGDLEAAAELLARAKEYQRAAQCYLKLNDKKAALEMYRRLGDVRKVAELRAELGDFFNAARDLLSLGEDARAMSILQRVEPTHPDFLDAHRLLCERLIQQGQYQRVRNILEPTIRSLKPRSQEAKEIYYLLAVASIKDNLVEKAKECLEQVLDIDYSFKDASQLYDSLLSGRGAG